MSRRKRGIIANFKSPYVIPHGSAGLKIKPCGSCVLHLRVRARVCAHASEHCFAWVGLCLSILLPFGIAKTIAKEACTKGTYTVCECAIKNTTVTEEEEEEEEEISPVNNSAWGSITFSFR